MPGTSGQGKVFSTGPFGTQFSVKELARSMSAPLHGAWTSLTTWGKYLQNHNRCGCQNLYHGFLRESTVCTDTGYARCKKARASARGGTVMCGSHM
eukprot:8796204-Pyramimonas_sp.AAC.1